MYRQFDDVGLFGDDTDNSDETDPDMPPLESEGDDRPEPRTQINQI